MFDWQLCIAGLRSGERESGWRARQKEGALRELNPGPPAPETRIIPLDQVPEKVTAYLTINLIM